MENLIAQYEKIEILMRTHGSQLITAVLILIISVIVLNWLLHKLGDYLSKYISPDGHPKYPTYGHFKIPHLNSFKM